MEEYFTHIERQQTHSAKVYYGINNLKQQQYIVCLETAHL